MYVGEYVKQKECNETRQVGVMFERGEYDILTEVVKFELDQLA